MEFWDGDSLSYIEKLRKKEKKFFQECPRPKKKNKKIKLKNKNINKMQECPRPQKEKIKKILKNYGKI